LDITNGAVLLTLSDLPAPAMDGYTFAGWYLDTALAQPFLLPAGNGYDQQFIDGSITLYPRFDFIPTPVVTPKPTATPRPTPKPTPAPTSTPTPTPEPTPTLEPAATPEQTATPVVQAPTVTQSPAIEPQDMEATIQQANLKLKNPARELNTREAEQNMPVMAFGIGLLLLMSAAVAALGVSICSDLQVLGWYNAKKQARRQMV
ncbi:MAG: InlB B-repeat-containing protein, partial [Syntrophomonadaceae bacterium]|nr:InlB B-repeat-containing protein [Syntrophomonadaceae bacterium]